MVLVTVLAPDDYSSLTERPSRGGGGGGGQRPCVVNSNEIMSPINM